MKIILELESENGKRILISDEDHNVVSIDIKNKVGSPTIIRFEKWDETAKTIEMVTNAYRVGPVEMRPSKRSLDRLLKRFRDINNEEKFDFYMDKYSEFITI